MDSRIIEKIRKLLALAGNNPSEAESTAAFARAQELATRHRIELASVEAGPDNPDDELIHETIEAGTKSHPGWRKVLMAGVFHACGVFVVLCHGGRYTLAGKRGDVDTAKYLYAAIANEIERLARVNAHGQGRSSEAALVKVERALSDAEKWYLRETGARLSGSCSVRTSSAAGSAAGRRDGQRINIGGNTAIGRGRLALGTGR